MVYTEMAENCRNNRIPNPGATRSSRVGCTIFQALSVGALARFTPVGKPQAESRPAR